MTYKTFGDYLESLRAYNSSLALTIRPLVKINRTTYKQLRLNTYKSANFLLSLNIKPGDRVMIMAANSPEWIELFLAVQIIGAVLVPVDARNSLPTAIKFFENTKPKVIFRGLHLIPELDKKAPTFILGDLHEYNNVFPSTRPDVKLNGDMMGLIVFTSGTTADPKGVVLTQKNVLSNVRGIQKAIKIDTNWRLLSVLPLSHMYEMTGTLAILSKGASIFYIPSITPVAIVGALNDYKITTILAIPQLLVLFLQRIQQSAAKEKKAGILKFATQLAAILPFKSRRLLFRSVHSRLGGHLKLVVTGGAPIPSNVAAAWERMGVKMVQGYGLTETSPILTVNGLDMRRLDSPGRPLDNLELRIAEDGEIQSKGPSVFKEYWHNPDATRAAFTEDGWFRTGDVGELRNGWLYIRGRSKFVIVLSSGLKVFPEDIEVVASDYPIFKSICVVGEQKATGEEVMAVVISDKSDEEVAEAVSRINQDLESFQHISSWRKWPDSDFPRTRLLKVDRRIVQQWVNSGSFSQTAKTKDGTRSEDKLIKTIQLTLNKPDASVKETDRLADIGLDSLRRLTLVALIEEQMAISISEEHVTKSTTVAEIRKFINMGTSAEPPANRPTWPYNKLIRSVGNGIRDSLFNGLVRIWVKTDVEGLENLTQLESPALFIFNHSDDFDGPVIYKAIPHHFRKRLAVAAAADVMREHKVLAFIIRFLFAGFNFSRVEPYMPSLEYVGLMVDRGWNIVLSPEGRVSTDGALQPFKSGIGLIATELEIPVVPIKTIGLHGTVPLHSKWPKRRSRVIVRIGEPVRFDAREDYDKTTHELHSIMEEL